MSRRICAFVLLALLLVAPVAMAAESDPDPTWIEIIQSWFEGLLEDDPEPTDPDSGTLHFPGG